MRKCLLKEGKFQTVTGAKCDCIADGDKVKKVGKTEEDCECVVDGGSTCDRPRSR